MSQSDLSDLSFEPVVLTTGGLCGLPTGGLCGLPTGGLCGLPTVDEMWVRTRGLEGIYPQLSNTAS